VTHAEEAERTVLGSMLLWWESCESAQDLLEAADFYAPIHQQIFQAIMSVREQGHAVETMSTIQRLRDMGQDERCGGTSYLQALQSTGCFYSSVPHYAAQVRDKSLARKAISLAQAQLKGLWELGTEPIGERLELVSQQWAALAGEGPEQVARPYREIMRDAFTIFEGLHEQQEQPAYKTGFSCLDDYVGGLHPGSLHILAARPTQGKTTLLLNWAMNLAKAHIPTVLFSMEMRDRHLVVRSLAAEAGVSGHLLRLGRLCDEGWQKVIDTGGELDKIDSLWISDRRGLRLQDLTRRIRQAVRQYKAKVVGIDYLTHIHAKAESKRLEFVEITPTLSALAGDLGIALVLLAQLSRQTEARENHMPTLADLKESGSIEEDADVVLFIHHQDGHLGSGTKHLIVAKNRLGPMGANLDVFWEPDHQRFRDVTQAEREQHEKNEREKKKPQSGVRKGNSNAH